MKSRSFFEETFNDFFKMQKNSSNNSLPRILSIVKEYFHMEIAFISHFSEGRRYFEYIDTDLDDPRIQVGKSDPLEGSYCKAVVDHQLPELINNAQVLSEAQNFTATKDFPIGAHISVPLELPDGNVYGTFCCFSRKPDETLNVRDLQIIHIFANIAAAIISSGLQENIRTKEIKDKLNDILKRNLLEIVFQPIFNIGENKIIGFESLSRFLVEPYRSPDVWFSEAMSVGLHGELELKAISIALSCISHLPRDAYLSINISPRVLFENNLNNVLEGYPIERIILEITEHDIIENYDELAKILKPFRDGGLKLAVDDAGAGYASFKHILQMSPDIIKLDISITRNIDKDSMRRSLARGLVSFSHTSNMKLIAEGVDSISELETLKSIGADFSQGYLLSKPVSQNQMKQAHLWL